MSDASLLIRLGVNTEALVAGIAKANGIMGSFQTTVQGLGRQLAAGVGFVGLGYAISNTVKSMAEFEHTMSAVKAITGATGDELDTLRGNALKMAAAFSSTEIAQFELEMARMGFTTNQVIDMTQAVVNLATATGENLAKSGEVAGSTMNAFGLQAKDMTFITDVMSGALNLSQMKLDDLTQGLKYVAPVARQAGVSLEETAAMLVILAQSGIKGSMASTSLRRILTDFTNDGVNASEKIAKLAKTGISLSDSFDEVGRTAQSTLAVLGNSGDSIQKLTVRLANMNGVTAEQAKIMQQDLTGAWNNLSAAWDRATKSGSFLTSMLAGLGNAGAEAMDRMTGNKSNEGFFTPGAPLPFLSGFWDFLGFGEGTDDLMKKNASLAGKKSGGTSGSNGGSVPDAIKNLPMTINEIEAKMKELKNKIGESFDPKIIAGFNDEIDKLQDKLYHMTNDKSGWFKDANKRAKSGDGFLGDVTPIATGTSSDQSDPFTVLANRVSSMVVKIKPQITTAKGLLDGFHLTAQRLGLTLAGMGSQMSTGFAQAIAGTVPFSQAMAQMADSVVNSLEQLVLAEIIQKSVEGSIGNPILAIAGAVAGFTAIKALFASIRGGGGGGGGSPSSAGIRANQSVALAPGEFRINGRDLVYTYDKNKALNPYAVGG